MPIDDTGQHICPHLIDHSAAACLLYAWRVLNWLFVIAGFGNDGDGLLLHARIPSTFIETQKCVTDGKKQHGMMIAYPVRAQMQKGRESETLANIAAQ